jgi:hypothetical protein
LRLSDEEISDMTYTYDTSDTLDRPDAEVALSAIRKWLRASSCHHPTMTKAEAHRAVRSIKWLDRTQLTTWSDRDAGPAERLNDLKAKN